MYMNASLCTQRKPTVAVYHHVLLRDLNNKGVEKSKHDAMKVYRGDDLNNKGVEKSLKARRYEGVSRRWRPQQ
jgi:hypothetical protein